MKIKPDFGFEAKRKARKTTPLLKLHGSFDWIQTVPIQREKLCDVINKGRAISWIGPCRSKDIKHYPFNLIWGKARELVAKADILRIIGCSMLSSDWHIAQLLSEQNTWILQ